MFKTQAIYWRIYLKASLPHIREKKKRQHRRNKQGICDANFHFSRRRTVAMQGVVEFLLRLPQDLDCFDRKDSSHRGLDLSLPAD